MSVATIDIESIRIVSYGEKGVLEWRQGVKLWEQEKIIGSALGARLMMITFDGGLRIWEINTWGLNMGLKNEFPLWCAEVDFNPFINFGKIAWMYIHGGCMIEWEYYDWIDL